MKAAVTALRHEHVMADEPMRRELVDVIDEELDRLNRFVGGVGGPTLSADTQSVVGELLQAVCTKAKAVASRHRVVTHVEEPDAFVDVDRAATVEALYLVLENASKYT